jgi:hypothetical protein
MNNQYIWTTTDVIEIGEESPEEVTLSETQADEVLELICENFDRDIGINNGVIEEWVLEWIRLKKAEHENVKKELDI